MIGASNHKAEKMASVVADGGDGLGSKPIELATVDRLCNPTENYQILQNVNHCASVSVSIDDKLLFVPHQPSIHPSIHPSSNPSVCAAGSPRVL